MNADKSRLRLGVNIDHVATLRNARGGTHPDPIAAAHIVATAGADGITAHLREDRRHITDDDIKKLGKAVNLPLNMEMAATEEMLQIALSVSPNAVCLVPERRQEITTEGGLDVVTHYNTLAAITKPLQTANVRVSLFIDPVPEQILAAAELEADIVELHTGSYCNAHKEPILQNELGKIQRAAALASSYGLEVHAGHGLRYDNVQAIAAINEIVELNIGHFLIGEAVFIGLHNAVTKMRELIDKARCTDMLSN